MFNKSTAVNRNEPVTRRDVQPVLGNARPLLPGITQKPPVAANAGVTPASTVNTPAEPAAPPVEPAPREAVADARLIVGPDVKLKGAEILDCDTLVVEGRVEATMDSRVIRIAEQGHFSGKVSIDIAEIHGHFEGELTARSQLIIHSTGRVSGTIRFGKLLVEEGGQLCGDVNIISARSVTTTSLDAQVVHTVLA